MTYTNKGNLRPFRAYKGNVKTVEVPDSNDVDFTQYSSGSFIGGLVPRPHRKKRVAWCKSVWSVTGSSATLAVLSSWSGSWRTDKSLMATMRGFDSGSFNFGDDSVYYLMGEGITYINQYAAYAGGSVSEVNTESCSTSVIFARYS